MKQHSTRLQIEQLEDRNLPSGASPSQIFAPMLPVPPPIHATAITPIPFVAGPTLHATAGVSFTGMVGFFPSPVLDPPDGYTASVKWGDGGNSNATVSLGEYNGQFGYVISATHTYAKPGTDSVKVTLFEGPINPASTLPTRTVETFVDKAIVQTSTAVPILASANTVLRIEKMARQLVIRSAAQLQAATGLSEAEVAAMLKVGSINWKTQMLVVVTGGFGGVSFLSPRPNITSLSKQGGVLTVEWDTVAQNPDQIIPEYVLLGNPASIVLTNRSDGPVDFQFEGAVVLPPPAGSFPLAV